MAITKLANIGAPKNGGRGHLKNCLNYIMDINKTDGLIGGNAGTTPQEVYQVMMETKQEWEKEWGRQGYHFVISFPPGEATKEQAYGVMKDFCEEYLGGNYDHVFAIHTDKGHMHGHIVFNSVSRTTGYKYRYEKGDWEKYIQPITDRICKKYGLPPLTYEKNNKIGKAYIAHSEEKQGRPNEEKIIRADIDYSIPLVKDWDEFIRQMESLGYTIRQGKNVTYLPPGFVRGRRDSRLGPEYQAEKIKERIQNKEREKGGENILSPAVSKEYEREIFSYTTQTTLTVFQLNKIRIFYQAGNYLHEKNPYAVAQKDVRKNAMRINQLYEECKYILRHDLKTEKDLISRQKYLREKESLLMQQRRNIFSTDLVQAGEEKKKINAMLREIRKEKRLINRIVEEEKTRKKEKAIFPTAKKSTEFQYREVKRSGTTK